MSQVQESDIQQLPTRVVSITLTLRLTPQDQLDLQNPDTWDWADLLDLNDDAVLGVYVTDQRLEYDEGTQ
jgi:hypothetical protein